MVRERGLAYRIYKINPDVTNEIKLLFKNSNNKICYNVYDKNENNTELTFSVKEVKENDWGSLCSIYLDKIMFLPDRDKR